MINNFEIINPLLSWDSEDVFYFCQVLKRKKENPELGSNSHVVKTYYIKSLEGLEKDYGEMVCLANYHNARVCINLNKRSFERTAFHTLKKITDVIMNKDYSQARKSYNSVCGMYAEGDKLWVLDVDNSLEDEQELSGYLSMIRPEGDKVVASIPSKNGYHLICKPFDINAFRDNEGDIVHEIHKNNPTNLYIP